MRKEEVTPEQFALWSFERDLKFGAFDEDENIKSWEDLSYKERDIYLAEASYYMNDECPLGWPDDILERLDEE